MLLRAERLRRACSLLMCDPGMPESLWNGHAAQARLHLYVSLKLAMSGMRCPRSFALRKKPRSPAAFLEYSRPFPVNEEKACARRELISPGASC